jgi:hypothetical protein
MNVRNHITQLQDYNNICLWQSLKTGFYFTSDFNTLFFAEQKRVFDPMEEGVTTGSRTRLKTASNLIFN